MFDTFKNRLEISGTLTTITALRISAGRSTEPIGTDLPVIKDVLGQPLIPGSSFKGALRSRLESFLRGIVGNNRKLVANPAIEEEWSLTSNELKKIKGLNLEQLIILYLLRIVEDFKYLSLEDLIEHIQDKNLLPENALKTQIIKIKGFNLDQLISLHKILESESIIESTFEEIIQRIQDGYLLPKNELNELNKKYNNDYILTAVVQYNTDIVSSLFGSPWIASKFQVRDLTIVDDTWFGQYQERDGVSIDRDTETAADGKLYDFQVVPAGTQFEFRAVVENATEWELGLLIIGLHQFETEQIPLGGGRSRGLGVVKLDIDKMWWLDVSNNPEKLLTYLQELVESKIGDKLPSYQDGKESKQKWTQSLITYLTENIPKNFTTTTQTQS
ncbi:type III CRISPR-associated RAMP protein Csx7 [Cylindrospermum sp. FACHB-282]|uniref:type III CRISPR-associated RAMP protein Csx7 n=1 Tax=Cylindrospermum sp. FACHB-282 TaxID=2692794 RepID=UPI001684756A|nr:CRISPR-associated RAMP protein Csx7 [Cylindrospermum sp. FACHB-282]MBD2384748.1 CRISPR-associated RAMP protein [Cylindrospermum sp. FACHB-282]